MLVGPLLELKGTLYVVQRNSFHRTDPGEGALASMEPMMQKFGVAHNKRRHTQTRCITDTQGSFKTRCQDRRLSAGAARSNMLELIERKLSDQKYRQHLSLKGILCLFSGRNPRAVTDPELAIAVNGRCPHQIAHFIKPARLRLLAPGKTVAHILKKTQAAVGARDNEVRRLESPCFLQRRLCPESVYIRLRRYSVEEDESRIPG